MNNGRPWFKFYPADWLGSRLTRFLSPEQKGYLIQLKAEAWQSELCGSLPTILTSYGDLLAHQLVAALNRMLGLY